MTKSELIEKVADRQKLPASQAETAVNIMFDSMATSLSAGEHIEIPGFGVIEVLEDEVGKEGT